MYFTYMGYSVKSGSAVVTELMNSEYVSLFKSFSGFKG